MTTHLLQVLPSVIREVDGEFEIEIDLANMLTGLAGDRAKIRDLLIAARVFGRVFDRDQSMQRRIDLIREYCCAA